MSNPFPPSRILDRYTYTDGTSPQGVGMGRKPNLWLKDGDNVEVALEGVGSCTNRVVFEKPVPKL